MRVPPDHYTVTERPETNPLKWDIDLTSHELPPFSQQELAITERNLKGEEISSDIHEMAEEEIKSRNERPINEEGCCPCPGACATLRRGPEGTKKRRRTGATWRGVAA